LKEKDEAHQKSIKRRKRSIGEREKEERIMAVIKDHQNDVKNSTLTQNLLEKYHQFTNQIKN
jgi:hypothetical protein